MVTQLPRDIDLLSDFVSEMESPDFNPVKKEYDPNWEPSLNPTQRKVYKSEARFILSYGERGSGKSVGAAHKMVKHCWNNFNALAILVVGVRRMATEGGLIYQLLTDVLPQWKEGVGMEFTEEKSNVAKDSYIFVSNKFGGWSKILLLSMPVGSFIKDRFKGTAPSFLLVDEIQTLESDEYFSVLVQQLGRRPGISDVQQYVATCNPLGPSSWVYKRFFEAPIDDEGNHNPLYATFHVPISENNKNLPPGYYENVLEAVKGDDTEYRRMVLGEWVDRPLGTAIFSGYYTDDTHLRGSVKDGTRILPVADHDIILGFDLGTANSSITFMQNIPTRTKDLWLVFDEQVYTDAYISYIQLVPAIMRRIDFWNKTCNTKFGVVSISDASAFNMFRATDGTYDSLEVERLSELATKDFPDVKPIKMHRAPKYPGSVAARIKIVIKLLQQERLLISAACPKTRDMFLNLESEQMKHGRYEADLPFQPKRSKHLHPFDSLSYPLHFFALEAPILSGDEPTNGNELMPIGTTKSY